MFQNRKAVRPQAVETTRGLSGKPAWGLALALIALLWLPAHLASAEQRDERPTVKSHKRYDKGHGQRDRGHDSTRDRGRRHQDRDRDRYDRNHRDRDHHDKDRWRDRNRHQSRERYRDHDRYRYEHRNDHYRHNDRYRHYGRYRQHHGLRSFSIPRQIVHDLLHEYEAYYHSRYYWADHHHYHTVYRFPVYYGDELYYRPYAYCEGNYFGVGAFDDDGAIHFDLSIDF